MSADVTWLRPFSEPFRAAIEPRLAPRAGRRVACFDADATLWAEDIGEAFLRWFIAGELLPAVDCRGAVYEEYERRVARSKTEGYVWAVALMAGLREDDVRRWARQLAAAWPNYRPGMAGLVRGLEAHGFEVWIVSASNEWIVKAAAPTMGFAADRAVGIATAVRDGVITAEPIRPAPSEAGKVEVIRQRIGATPELACGDSLGDLAMLESAEQPLVVGRRDQPEAKLLHVAAERGWPVTLF
jgi:HAD superfamily phosphoserine phosphatase-like hydrolase